ncbi:DUF6962 family protein [Geoalkalibacter subterraneus]|nr:hypothetical protein [Geoalkalibacter subterraneus]
MIHEPMTVLTDYLLGMWVLWLGGRLWRQGRRLHDRAIGDWSLVFIFSAVAAFCGGTVHGFPNLLGGIGSALLWKLTVQAVGIASLCFLAAMIRSMFRGRVRRILLAAAFVKWAVYAWWMTSHDAFLYVVLDYLPSLLFVGGLQAWCWLRQGRAAGRWITLGVVISLVAAGIQQSGFSLHRHFNHNDLYHVVQMAAFYLLYRGGILLRQLP